jgi:hypothetical protein
MKKKVGILLICSSLLVGRSEGALESGQTSDFQSIVENEDAIGGYTPVHHYQKSKDATDKIKGIAPSYCFWYNPNLWKIEKKTPSPNNEIHFSSTIEGLRGAVTTEPFQIQKEEIESLVWEKAEYNFDDVDFLHKDTRVVNGLVVDCFQWAGTFAGKKETLGGKTQKRGSVCLLHLYSCKSKIYHSHYDLLRMRRF